LVENKTKVKIQFKLFRDTDFASRQAKRQLQTKRSTHGCGSADENGFCASRISQVKSSRQLPCFKKHHVQNKVVKPCILRF